MGDREQYGSKIYRNGQDHVKQSLREQQKIEPDGETCIKTHSFSSTPTIFLRNIRVVVNGQEK